MAKSKGEEIIGGILGAGMFGALGHSINDVDTGKQVEVQKGAIYVSDVVKVVKGREGAPGEIEGVIQYVNGNIIGSIDGNTNYGVYGHIYNTEKLDIEEDYMPIATKQEVKLGKAYLRSYVNGKKEDYEIEIVDINMNSDNVNKGIEILVVDDKLINTTGGIVQGMSGTPIIQDNKVVGAVTHVFVQNSRRGYATFVENMMDKAKNQ